MELRLQFVARPGSLHGVSEISMRKMHCLLGLMETRHVDWLSGRKLEDKE